MQAERKREIINEYRINDKDSGSAKLQVALLTERINEINRHLQTHKKDFACQRGLLMLVGRRNRMLRYLKKKDPANYGSLISRLGLRK